jgi:hypothetical protein
MKLISKISDMITDELCGAREYAVMALEYRELYPDMARIMYTHSLAESQHADDLHRVVVELIEEHRRKNGEPPAVMMELYDYLHRKHIEDAAEVKVMQQSYKGV